MQDIAAGKIPHTANISPRLRVLVVDDEPLIRWSLLEALADLGHTVVDASDGESAIRAVSDGHEPFDVVLLDFRMPDSNSLDLLATIRRLAPTSAVIMMTAFGTPEVVAGALKLGAFRVIPKPFEFHDIAALVLQAHQAAG